MFIENALNPITRAPAERNVSHIDPQTDLCFAPLERGEFSRSRAFYEHLAPLGRCANNVLLQFEIEFANRKSTAPTIRRFIAFRPPGLLFRG
jgi:hypothetical protein